MVQVSASMVIRDEEERLEAALTSLAQLEAIDEVVILDTGSKDRSVEIARDLGARVFEERWQDDFALHRNRCLQRCRNDWVFILDGDEELVDAGDLGDFLAAPQMDGAGLQVAAINVGGGPIETLLSLRAFDKRVGSWRYPIHNVIVGIDECYLSSARLKAWYDQDIESATRHRLEVLLRHARDAGGDPHYPFHLAKSYAVLQEPEETLRWATRYFECDEPGSRGAIVATWMIGAHLALGAHDQAERVLAEARRRYPRFPDLEHLELTLALLRWVASVEHPEPDYLSVPQYTRSYLSGVQAAVGALGLPLAVRALPPAE